MDDEVWQKLSAPWHVCCLAIEGSRAPIYLIVDCAPDPAVALASARTFENAVATVDAICEREHGIEAVRTRKP